MAKPNWVSERTWLTAQNPTSLLPYQGNPHTRQAIAMYAACFERLATVLPTPVAGWLNLANDVLAERRSAAELERLDEVVWDALWNDFQEARDQRREQLRTLIDLWCAFCKEGIHEEPGPVALAEMAAQAEIVREVFGNPFRTVKFQKKWRTDTATAIARQMYESRDFSAMPILADALQDAGCENTHILNHCRDEKQVHVRGCWVVDLVLGKG